MMGSNMAENHPVAFRFVAAGEAARRDGHPCRSALHPHLARSADIHAPIRSGTDIAFLGGIIHYILENDLWFRDFALAYTNIADHHRGRLSGRRAARRRLLGLRRRKAAATRRTRWQYEGEVRALAARGASRADASETSEDA